MSVGLPPQNLDAERGTIASVLLDNEMLHEIVGVLRVADFYREAHQELWRGIMALYDRGEPIDTISLAEELTRRGTFAEIGGDETLATIMASVAHAASGVYHARIVSQKAIAREVLEVTLESQRKVFSNTMTADELLDSIESRVYAIADGRHTGGLIRGSDAIATSIDLIAQRAQGAGTDLIGTGFVDFDDLVGGLQAGLVILAGRPSTGKTAFGLNIVDHVLTSLVRPCMVVSLEMSNTEIAERMLVAKAGIDGARVRRGNLPYETTAAIDMARHRLRDIPLVIDEGPYRTVSQIVAMARRQSSRNGLALLMVDYLQLIDADKEGVSRLEQVANISRRLKTLSKEISVPILALSQLNREAEKREDHRPRMADLRECGSLEQDADLVLLLHRPEYYDPNDQPGVAELIVAKNRNGPTGTVKLTFIKSSAMFRNFHEVISAASEGPGY